MTNSPEQVEIWVVVRHDRYLRDVADGIEQLITLKEAFPTPEEAQAEVDRLTALRQERGESDGVQYFAAWTRYFPSGRNVQVRY